MQFIFRDATEPGFENIEPGLLVLKPLPDEDRDRRDLALYALDHGADGFLRGNRPIEKIVLPAHPTLDDILAGQIVERFVRGESLPEGMRAFCQYAKTIRQGLQAGTVPPEASLEGIYWAIRSQSGDDLSASEEAARFSNNCARLMDRIVPSAAAGLDPHHDRLFDDAEFSLERGLLNDDKKVYRQDVARGRSSVVQIPDGPPEASALLLNRPKSMLFKHWSRGDQEAPSGDGYTLIISNEGDGAWVITTPRSSRLSLKELATKLQHAESARDAQAAEVDPWYDGKAFDHTLVAAPKRGTHLSDAEVLQIIDHWAKPRQTKRISSKLQLAAAGLLTIALVAIVYFVRTAGTKSLDANGVTAREQVNDELASVGGTTNDVATRGDRRYQRNGVVNKGIYLYCLNIGVSDYADDSFDLNYADDDAEAFSSALKAQEGRPFEKVVARTLTNQDATRSNILTEFDWLRKQATQHDLVMVTVSGHGMREEDEYYFIPHDYRADKVTRATAVSWDDFSVYLNQLPCPAVLVMDTCHSGTTTVVRSRGESEKRALNRAVKNFGKVSPGVVIIAASMGRQLAQERDDWKHGVLTLALLEGIEGRYLYDKQQATKLPRNDDDDQVLSLKELEYFASRRVKELAGGEQAVIGKHPGDVNLDDIPISMHSPEIIDESKRLSEHE